MSSLSSSPISTAADTGIALELFDRPDLSNVILATRVGNPEVGVAALYELLKLAAEKLADKNKIIADTQTILKQEQENAQGMSGILLRYFQADLLQWLSLPPHICEAIIRKCTVKTEKNPANMLQSSHTIVCWTCVIDQHYKTAKGETIVIINMLWCRFSFHQDKVIISDDQTNGRFTITKSWCSLNNYGKDIDAEPTPLDLDTDEAKGFGNKFWEALALAWDREDTAYVIVKKLLDDLRKSKPLQS